MVKKHLIKTEKDTLYDVLVVFRLHFVEVL
jgi:hypothetical protein